MRIAIRLRPLFGLAALLLVAAASAAPDKPRAPNPPSSQRRPLPIERAILLDGRPFPRRSSATAVEAPAPRRTLYAAPSGAGGDGSEKKPWTDLSEAMRQLEPGDRLVLQKGTYVGAFRVDGSCRDGQPGAPIQIVGKQAKLQAGGEAPALVVARQHWWFEGLRFSANGSPEPLLLLEKGAGHVTLQGASLRPDSRTGIELRGASDVLVANTQIVFAGRGRIETPSNGVAVSSGSSDVRLEGLLVAGPGGSGVRVGEETGDPPSSVSLSSSTVRDTLGPAVRILSGRNVLVRASDLFQSSIAHVASGEGVRIEAGDGIRVLETRIGDFALAVRVGVRSSEAGASAAVPQNVVLERSFLESRSGLGSGVAVEAGRGVRISNNMLSGFEEAFVIFGKPPVTARLTVANNLAVGISRLAFRLEGRDPARIFDYNAFAAAGKELPVEVDGKTLDLSVFLCKKTMPHTALVRDLILLHGDLGAVKGLETIDRGMALDGVTFLGKAPDIGIAER